MGVLSLDLFIFSLGLLPALLEIQLLSWAASSFIGSLGSSSGPGRKHQKRTRPAAMFRAKEVSFVPRTDPSTH